MTRPYYIIFNIVALFIVIYVAVDVFFTIVRGKFRPDNTTKVIMPLLPEVRANQGPALDDFKVIIERNIFGSTEKEDEKIEVEEEEIESLEPTSLKVFLIGTVAGDQENALAVIVDPTKKTQNYLRVWDMVQDAVVKKILR